ncbi:aspartate/glutamate racemase family protein [Desulfovibrio cuneatus]|uniref:aspartate/glutamate racemase family protein n=1 Tax=Desulfovibrio cuneatus TaxID=159728 RepID=UPI0004879314|nr:amino acid racemase [Desulfovibrio cuneatus]
MEKLGLIGGMGPESTLIYYKQLNYGFQQANTNNHFPAFVLENVDVHQVLQFCAVQDYPGLCSFLLNAIHNVAKAGATFAALAANTPHIVYEQLVPRSPIPLVSIIETTCSAVQKKQMTKVGLLGTSFTMQQDFYKKPFHAAGISVAIPCAEDAAKINTYIMQELERGIFLETTKQEFLRVIHKMQEDQGIEGIILGCTEIPLLLPVADVPLPAFDTMQEHIDALVQRMLGH